MSAPPASATELKAKGNEAYEKKDYTTALKHYTEALAVEEKLPALWTNRAACYALLGRHNDALQDAKKAIALDASWAKGWFRAALAYGKLNHTRDAVNHLKECSALELKQVGKVSTVVEEALRTASVAHLVACHADKTRGMKVEVKYISEAKGRGVFARHRVRAGEVVFDEEPIVSHRTYEVTPKSQTSPPDSCARCMRTILTVANLQQHQALFNKLYPQPPKWEACVGCKDTPIAEKYCSTECMTLAAKEYHKILCPGAAQDPQNRGEGHPLVKIFQRARDESKVNPLLIARMLAMVVQRRVDGGLGLDEAFEPFRLFSSLPEQEGNQSFLAEEVVAALNSLTSHLGPVVSEIVSVKVYKEFYGILTRNAHTLLPVSDLHLFLNSSPPAVQQSVVDLFDKRLDPSEFVSSAAMVRLCPRGTGLYAVSNSMNHSCAPNVMSACSHNSHRLSTIALQDIAEGEELLISYIDEEAGREQRRAKLRQFYDFECNCKLCYVGKRMEQVAGKRQKL